jgi:hypothetical protein
MPETMQMQVRILDILLPSLQEWLDAIQPARGLPWQLVIQSFSIGAIDGEIP